MAVVINEFEVLDAPAPTPDASNDGASSATPPAPLEPEDLRRMLAAGAELQLRRLPY
jgi:hypothetical protein